MNKITRTKRFVQDHSHGVVTAAGAVAGAAVMFKLTHKGPPTLTLELARDHALHLLDNPECFVKFNAPNEIIKVFITPLES